MDIAAQLALVAKVGLVFEADDTFLSFPLLQPVSFAASTLDFSQALSDPSTMASLLTFSRCVSACPLGPSFQDMGDAYLWERYDEWLSTMQLATSQLSSADKAAYEAAKTLLTSLDPVTGVPGDSQAYITYKQCRDAYMTALQALRAAKLSPTPDDPSGQVLAELQQAFSDAEAAWSGVGRKADIEGALATRAHLDAEAPQSAWAEWRSRYQPAVDEVIDPASQASFAPSGFSPSNVSDQDWTRLTLQASEIRSLVPQAPPALRALAPPDGGSDIASISLEVRSVSVVRSWFDSRVFSARFWRFQDEGQLSDGAVPPHGDWPAYVAAVVFARNIEVVEAAAPASPPTPIRVLPPLRPPINRPIVNPITRPPILPFRPGGLPVGPGGGAIRRLLPMMAEPRPAVVEGGPVRALAPRPTVANPPPGLRPSPISRLQLTTFTLPPPPSPSTAGVVGPTPTPSAAPDSDVSILALICRALPKAPNPDPALTW